MWMWWLVWSGAGASAGYGDAIRGVPTHAERELHLFTNLVRLDPEAFAADIPCWDELGEGARTPKSALLWHAGLAEVAHLHSVDMDVDGYFSHDSNDGTAWSARVREFYPSGTLAENIANGHRDPWSALFDGWMCSSVHRRIALSDNYDELGTGVSSRKYTQDFGERNPSPQPLAMGVHLPEVPESGGTVELLVVYAAASGAAPERIEVVVSGRAHRMELAVGSPAAGGYAAEVSTGGGCQAYFFEASIPGEGVVRFPEQGSYGWGTCAFDDPEAGWLSSQIAATGRGTPGGGGGDGGDSENADLAGSTVLAGTEDGVSESGDAADCGCAHGTPAQATGWVALLAMLGGRRRRG